MHPHCYLIIIIIRIYEQQHIVVWVIYKIEQYARKLDRTTSLPIYWYIRIRIFGYKCIKIFGHRYIRIFEYRYFRIKIFGHLYIRIFGYHYIRISGFLDILGILGYITVKI